MSKQNGNMDLDMDESHWPRHLLPTAGSVDDIVPALNKAVKAIDELSTVFGGVARSLAKISGDTARAISETIVLKKYLKLITDREQVVRRELDELKDYVQSKRRLRKTSKQKKRRGGKSGARSCRPSRTPSATCANTTTISAARVSIGR